MTILYLVPLPLGDPDDITMRALRNLSEVSAIAADEISAGRALLAGYGIATPLIGYSEALDALARGDVALISTRGTPGISTGQEVVQGAIARGIQVVPLPGADAAITALVLSGLPTDAFVYVGTRLMDISEDDLSRYANERATMIFTATVQSKIALKAGLKRLLDAFGERRISILKPSQPNEAAYRGLLSAALNDVDAQPGNIVLVVEGAAEQPTEVWDEERVRAELRRRLAADEPLKLAAKAIANAAGWDRRTVYGLGVEEKGKTP